MLPSLSPAGLITRKELFYTVKKGDAFELVGARTGVNWRKIAKDNNIDTKKWLQIGRKLRVNARKIVPPVTDNSIIKVQDRTLYYFRDGQVAQSFPVGLGMLTAPAETNWKTPLGRSGIIATAKDPIWYVPPSIR